jgi:thioredoxin-like negative regulator of GroEL
MRKLVLVGGLAVVLAGLGLWFLGRPAYRHFKERRAMDQARQFAGKGDFRNASLSARQALLVNPRNADACRLMAELSELARSTNALDWHRRVAEVEPTMENRLRVAAAALRYQPPPFTLATEILEELAGSATNLPAYHVVAAERALKLKRVGEAIAHFEAASRLEPANEQHQLNLAVLNLQSTNAATAAAARATLDRLRASTNLAAVALRWLVGESLKNRDFPAAERFSSQLLEDRQCTMEDRLQHLSLLREGHSAAFPAALEAAQHHASTNPAAIYGLSAWMLSHQLVQEALEFLESCPETVRKRQPVPMAFVDVYVAKKDWDALESFLLEEKWGELDFMRQALLSRAAAEQGQTQAADVRWRSAIREAADRLGPLTSLLSMATHWKREKAREELLWQIAQRFPREKWALRELDRLYAEAGNTRGLHKLYSHIAGYDAKNVVAQNNFAATSLLLRLNLARAHEIARNLYQLHPEDAVVTSTYAYSLHLQGRTPEALAALEKLKPEALENPSVALYYGCLLVSAGRTNQGARYLELARQGNLLPEEKQLLAAAGASR